jgi:palmitoyltransferase
MSQRRSKHSSYEQDYENPLCLCEYFNRHQQRTHILMCCCNCEALDKLFTVILCCNNVEDDEISQSFDNSNKSFRNFITQKTYLANEALHELFDRLRIPMPGGAKKISIDFIISFFTILLYLMIGTNSFFSSILTILIIPCVLYFRFFLSRIAFNKKGLTNNLTSSKSENDLKNLKNTKKNDNDIQIAFFIMLNALLIILIIYNFSLSYELKSSKSQYFIINFFIISNLCMHFYLHFSNPGFLIPSPNTIKNIHNDNYCKKCNINRDSESNIGHCPLCKYCSYKRDHHCFWIDNCIGYLNHKAFLIYLVLLIGFFLYSFWTIFNHLSSMPCKMTIFWPSVIESNDAFSCLFDVYYSNFDRSILTLLFIQLIPLCLYMLMLLMQQFLFISLGKTQYQLFKISQNNIRFSLIVYLANNLKFRTMAKNWFYFLFRSRRKSDLLNLVHQQQLNSYDDHFI